MFNINESFIKRIKYDCFYVETKQRAKQKFQNIQSNIPYLCRGERDMFATLQYSGLRSIDAMDTKFLLQLFQIMPFIR